MLRRLLLLLVAGGPLASAGLAAAETLKISGLPFTVDSLADVDSANVKVSVLGETQVIARSNLDDFVARKYFESQQASAAFSATALRGFVNDSIGQKKPERAAAALDAWCRNNPDKAAEVGEFLSALPHSEATRSFFMTATESVDSKHCAGNAAAEILLRAGSGDLEWLKTKGLRFTFDHAGSLRTLAERKILQAGSQRNFQDMNRYLQFYGAAFGAEDAKYLELKALYTKATQAMENIQKGELETIYPLIEQVKVDAVLSDILSPLLTETLHTHAAKALSRNDPAAALAILSQFDLRKRTPTTHQLIAKAVGELQPASNPAPGDPATAHMLRTVAEADEQVRQAYLGYLDRLLRYFIEAGAFDDVSTYFEILKSLRPDPNVENDRLRVRQVSAYLDRKMMVSAREKLKQVQTGVPFFSRLRFVLRGLYFDPMYIVIAVVSPIAAGIVIYLVELLGRLRRRVTAALRRKPEPEEDEEEEIQPAFVRSGLVRAMSPSMIEYRECLQVFGLSDGATLKVIKAAYRNAVKSVHPDLNKNLDAKASERFILLTKTYERILELYEQAQPLKAPPVEGES